MFGKVAKFFIKNELANLLICLDIILLRVCTAIWAAIDHLGSFVRGDETVAVQVETTELSRKLRTRIVLVVRIHDPL